MELVWFKLFASQCAMLAAPLYKQENFSFCANQVGDLDQNHKTPDSLWVYFVSYACSTV
jgi:hypothetical protein